MGDGHPSPSRNDSESFPFLRLVNPGQQPLPDSVARLLARTVLYTHSAKGLKESDRRASGVSIPVSLCSRLEELFVLLEHDAVDTLVFDESLKEQERLYVSGWARIFKPSVRCESRDAFETRLAAHVA